MFFRVVGARHAADLQGSSQFQKHLQGSTQYCAKSVSDVEENWLVDFRGHGSEFNIWRMSSVVFACPAGWKLTAKHEVISFSEIEF